MNARLRKTWLRICTWPGRFMALLRRRWSRWLTWIGTLAGVELAMGLGELDGYHRGFTEFQIGGSLATLLLVVAILFFSTVHGVRNILQAGLQQQEQLEHDRRTWAFTNELRRTEEKARQLVAAGFLLTGLPAADGLKLDLHFGPQLATDDVVTYLRTLAWMLEDSEQSTGTFQAVI